MEKEEFWKKFCDFCKSDLWPIAEKLMKECSDFKKLIDNKILEQYLDNLSTITLYNMPHMRGSVREILKKPNFTMDEIKKEIENFKNQMLKFKNGFEYIKELRINDFVKTASCYIIEDIKNYTSLFDEFYRTIDGMNS